MDILKEFESGLVFSEGSGVLPLYHGSKNGIDGKIRPASRLNCDFGKAFYMGVNEEQPKQLVCDGKCPTFYHLDFNLSGLKVLDLTGFAWMLVVAFHRRHDEMLEMSPLLHKYLKNKIAGVDVLVGVIADDKLSDALDDFFEGNVTDKCLFASMSAIKYGRQYAAKTQKACDQISIRLKEVLPEDDVSKFATDAAENRKAGGIAWVKTKRRFLGEGRYFPIIVENFGKCLEEICLAKEKKHDYGQRPKFPM